MDKLRSLPPNPKPPRNPRVLPPDQSLCLYQRVPLCKPNHNRDPFPVMEYCRPSWLLHSYLGSFAHSYATSALPSSSEEVIRLEDGQMAGTESELGEAKKRFE